MNLKIISSNINEALEDLQKIQDSINSKNIDEVEFQLSLQHVCHHLNVAWNMRNQETERYGNMTHEDFQTFGKFPKDLFFDE